MALDLDPVISSTALKTPVGLRLFDVRSGPNALAAYRAGHLPGAVHADLDTQLAGPATHPARGGRHPLPAARVFAAQLGAWGVTPDTHVVAYDDMGGMNAASRLWWMLRAVGHERVQVLDGGLQAAIAAGIKATSELPTLPSAPPYPISEYLLPTADIDEVDAARKDPARCVLDVRSAARYRGESEPIDPIAGHIPGAKNLPMTENLDIQGRFKSAEELRAQYTKLLGDVPVSDLTVHCGSGVTACHTLLSLERARLHGARLYVGSWGEWCRTGREREPA